MGRIPDETAPCGVYCGACPSIGKSCRGCGSHERKQNRKSKWACKIRNCCFDIKNLSFCFECDEFPCNFIEKLKNSHPNESKFRYRHEIFDNLEKIKRLGVKNWIKEQEKKYKCPKCPGNMVWYDYKCKNCGYDYFQH